MIANLKPYPAMRESGVEWLGEVPEYWEVRRNGRLFAQRNEVDRPDLPILEVSLRTGVRVRGSDKSDRKQVMSDRDKYKRAVKGDIAYNMMRMWQGAVGVAPVAGLVSPAYVVARPLPGTDARYFQKLFRTPSYMQEVNRYSHGIVKDRNRLYWEDFKAIPTCYPPPEEQAAIVRFLDHVDRRIRRYIRAKRKLIALLTEQKQAIIHRAVTRGLDPNVPLKDSGVEWLGEVPAHWKLLRGKYVGKLFSTPSVSDESLTDVGDGLPMYLKVSDLGKVDTESRLRVSALYVSSSSETPVNAIRSCIVFPKRGGAIYTNKVAIVEGKFLLDPNLMGWAITDSFEPRYVALLVRTRTLADLADVSSVPQINNKHINPIFFPAPPIKEQRAILSWLESALADLVAVEFSAESEIALLRAYRTRLIADVVIGKLDARETAASLPEEPDTPADEAEFDDMLSNKSELIEADTHRKNDEEHHDQEHDDE